eukprot:TRINITY_DN7768_c0_g1_i1.p3 TRINITY_DN7768_c0_g1~~TRINITY_DN7768_c0_g1_i1.p3  ORF type:complete len:66 (+),score=9.60 TRINITY_DN7768_c0_g1_i1:560-757(+)
METAQKKNLFRARRQETAHNTTLSVVKCNIRKGSESGFSFAREVRVPAQLKHLQHMQRQDTVFAT